MFDGHKLSLQPSFYILNALHSCIMLTLQEWFCIALLWEWLLYISCMKVNICSKEVNYRAIKLTTKYSPITKSQSINSFHFICGIYNLNMLVTKWFCERGNCKPLMAFEKLSLHTRSCQSADLEFRQSKVWNSHKVVPEKYLFTIKKKS